MKTLFSFLLLVSLTAASAQAQTDSVRVRSAFGSSLQLTPYRWNSRSELVENNTRFALDGGLQFIRFFGENWYVQSGIENAKRRNIRPVNGEESHVNEEFMQIPLLVGYGSQRAASGKFNQRLNLAGGIYGAQLMRQGIAPVGSTRVKMEKRENDYWKFGVHLEASLMFMPKNEKQHLMHVVGIRSFIDIRDAYIQNDKSTPVFSNYTGGSLFYTLYFTKNRKP